MRRCQARLLIALFLGFLGGAHSAHADLNHKLFLRNIERLANEAATAEQEEQALNGLLNSDAHLDDPSQGSSTQLTLALPIDPAQPKLGTFNQNYWVNATYASGPNAPVLFFLCGEWTCSANYNSMTTPIAKALGAYQVAVEHRFYGATQPFTTLSTENLQYLRTDLALGDFAALQKNLMLQGMTGPWIVVGASYSAALAAYYRQAYPELAAAAWASSGPVHAKADFYEYDRHVVQVLGPECAGRAREALQTIESALADPTTNSAIKARFNAPSLSDDEFMDDLSGVPSGYVQYGGYDGFCSTLMAPTAAAPVDGYLTAVQNLWGTGELTSWIDVLKAEDDLTSGERQWFYQTCTEYGFWQTAQHSPAISLRPQRIGLAYYTDICSKLFGITSLVNTRPINHDYYEPIVLKGSKIFFANGSNDPWSELSIQPDNHNDLNPGLATAVSYGAFHCGDLSGKDFPDGSALAATRAFGISKLREWLDLPTPPPAPPVPVPAPAESPAPLAAQ